MLWHVTMPDLPSFWVMNLCHIIQCDFRTHRDKALQYHEDIKRRLHKMDEDRQRLMTLLNCEEVDKWKFASVLDEWEDQYKSMRCYLHNSKFIINDYSDKLTTEIDEITEILEEFYDTEDYSQLYRSRQDIARAV